MITSENMPMQVNYEKLSHLSDEQIAQSQATFMSKIYSWMLVGLVITGALAWFTFNSSIYETIASYSLFLMIATLGIVFFLSFRIQKMSATTAMLSFIVYSALNGFVFSTILAVYTMEAIYNAFFVSAGAFGALSIYGYTTKRDLSPVGKFMFMGLIGIILASVLNMFFANSAISLMISIVGVVVFAGLTAYDTQRLKEMHLVQLSGEENATKAIIMGALSLYLNFINLFLILLRFFGGSRD